MRQGETRGSWGLAGRALSWWRVSLGGLAVGLLVALPHAVGAYAREPSAFGGKLALALVPSSAWALLAPLILALFLRVGRGTPGWARRTGVLIAVGGLFVLLHAVLLSAMLSVLEDWPARGRVFSEGLRTVLLERGALGSFEYLLFLAAWMVLSAVRRVHERELAESRWKAQLAESRLQALRAQLDPHFLFNTLNAVVGLVRQSRNPEAVDALVRLGELLRASLEGRGSHEVPLSEELGLVRRYLEIEQLRFGARLAWSLVPEPETLSARVPSLVLQPLVENAIKHGTSRRVSKGHVRVHASRQGAVLVLEVQDDGPGLGEGTVGGMGIGVANTRDRIHQLHGEAFGLTLEDAAEGGVIARVRLPFVVFERSGS
ncbi:signal transduction histidine kinase LytS [Myxococcus stipitatus DSM 14675]|uniref:Signal transduction histidine kinase LytS n=1 Tax=Myxococcus stipitatus (strain DSM 14675 / JCM 12634 / Mx s8) TaxID=1278073 RepID=L7UFX3_MYXSD|nr:histidine kinase [Myxococcus stipitatus]AGC45354.1 signal transduction histidine kinase LytS [Myxococcus stipitatus DSM 14675]